MCGHSGFHAPVKSLFKRYLKPVLFHANNCCWWPIHHFSMLSLDDYHTRWVSMASSRSICAFSLAHRSLKKTSYLFLYLNTVLKFFVVFLGIWMKQSPYVLIRNVVFQFLHISACFETSPVSMLILKHNQLLQTEQFVSKFLTFILVYTAKMSLHYRDRIK